MSVPLHRFLHPVETVTLDESVVTAARKMREAGVGCVVVVRGSHPVAILTDRDITIRVVAEGRDARKTLVSDVVTYDPIVLSTSDGIETAFEVIKKHGVRRLPIVDGAGHLAGLVTADDLTMLVGRELAGLAAGIEGASDSTESR